MFRCKPADTPQRKRLFLSLPQQLYRRSECPQDRAAEEALLAGTHPLSGTFRLCPLIVSDEKETRIAARCALTLYPDEQKAYLGFFECIDNDRAAAVLFAGAFACAGRLGCTGLTGPVDASFWIRYRMKLDHFGKPYTCEPYNLPYYERLWKAAGFTVTETYCSNRYDRLPADYRNEKGEARLRQCTAQGITIRRSSPAEFQKDLTGIYQMMTELYASFPAYRPIGREAFLRLFSPLKSVLEYDLVLMACKDKKPVGFFVTIPDYGNRLVRPTGILNLLAILHRKYRPEAYVLLYLGVRPEYAGLGLAFSEVMAESRRFTAVQSYGALIHGDKVTKGYFREQIRTRYRYALWEKTL